MELDELEGAVFPFLTTPASESRQVFVSRRSTGWRRAHGLQGSRPTTAVEFPDRQQARPETTTGSPRFHGVQCKSPTYRLQQEALRRRHFEQTRTHAIYPNGHAELAPTRERGQSRREQQEQQRQQRKQQQQQRLMGQTASAWQYQFDSESAAASARTSVVQPARGSDVTSPASSRGWACNPLVSRPSTSSQHASLLPTPREPKAPHRHSGHTASVLAAVDMRDRQQPAVGHPAPAPHRQYLHASREEERLGSASSRTAATGPLIVRSQPVSSPASPRRGTGLAIPQPPLVPPPATPNATGNLSELMPAGLLPPVGTPRDSFRRG